jgi:predicted TIM-barrel enzyme
LSGATGVLATVVLPNPSMTISGSGTVIATLLGVPLSIAASATGTAAKAEIRNTADAVIVAGLTVGTSAADIILNSVSITTAQTVTISSGVITHAA